MDEQLHKELSELVDWYRDHQPTEVRRSQILTFGTDSDRILLQLFVRFGGIADVFSRLRNGH